MVGDISVAVNATEIDNNADACYEHEKEEQRLHEGHVSEERLLREANARVEAELHAQHEHEEDDLHREHEQECNEHDVEVRVTCNGLTKLLRVDLTAPTGLALAAAIKLFAIQPPIHRLALYTESGAELVDTKSLKDQGVKRCDLLVLRQSAVRGGRR